MYPISRFSTLFVLFFFAFGFPRCPPADGNVLYIDTGTFIRNACIAWETGFAVETSLDHWNKVLDNLSVMAELWKFYNFHPAYKVIPRGDYLHVVDPTGIEGDLIEVSRTAKSRVFYARGRIKNWGLPMVVSGKALFIVRYEASGNMIHGTFAVYGEGSGTAADLVIRAVSPVLKLFIKRRVLSNLRDLKTIIADINHNPDKIARALPPSLRKKFSLVDGEKAYR